MIPKAYITEWRSHAPWSQDAWVEQDLVISRALVGIFGAAGVAERLAFRGGTALYKLYLTPAARYSEDIDLVQTRPEPIGETPDAIRAALDPWLGTPKRLLKEGRVKLVYRFDSEDAPPLRLRLKIEINSREHFSELGLVRVPFRVENRWFTGEAKINTFAVNELLATKLRALYQRKKGRDLFDLWLAIEKGVVEPSALLACFLRYMTQDGQAVSRAQFEANLHEKRSAPVFRADIEPLLRPGLHLGLQRRHGHGARTARCPAAGRAVEGPGRVEPTALGGSLSAGWMALVERSPTGVAGDRGASATGVAIPYGADVDGLGPCWEMDYSIRAARAGFVGVWACAAYVHRAPFTARRRVEEAKRFGASRHRYQDKILRAPAARMPKT